MPDWPRWAGMWMLALMVYATCKALTWWTIDASSVPRWKQLAYLVAWPGMDAATFFGTHRFESCCQISEWFRATSRLFLGLWLVFGAAGKLGADDPYVAGWIGMVGFALILHFGAFH